MSIRAIETEFLGYRFRSRLEARYAVFFNALKTPWEYEKEGYELSDGTRYLPDFWMRDLKCWIEIKPEYPTRDEIRKAERLGELGPAVVIAYGLPDEKPLLVYCGDAGESAGVTWREAQWAQARSGGELCFACHAHDRDFYDAALDEPWSTMRMEDQCRTNTIGIRRAVNASRSARFEFLPRNMRRALEDGGVL